MLFVLTLGLILRGHTKLSPNYWLGVGSIFFPDQLLEDTLVCPFKMSPKVSINNTTLIIYYKVDTNKIF